ncbi:MAG: hypothetical protein NUV69_02940 [Candidatus Curtissbacteria bacterium]|nr:hypothetical protein [Candidatus Curtissbacteria bacterium]
MTETGESSPGVATPEPTVAEPVVPAQNTEAPKEPSGLGAFIAKARAALHLGPKPEAPVPPANPQAK